MVITKPAAAKTTPIEASGLAPIIVSIIVLTGHIPTVKPNDKEPTQPKVLIYHSKLEYNKSKPISDFSDCIAYKFSLHSLYKAIVNFSCYTYTYV